MARTDPTPATLRLLTYNVHGCIDCGGVYDFEAILQVLSEIDADVVALQEVYDEAPEDRQFLKALKRTPYPFIEYGRTLMHESRGAYGNVLLSKWPLEEVERLDISVPDAEPRGAIRAQVALPRARIDLTATHLGLGAKERGAQIERLMSHWKLPQRPRSRRRPFVLMGDLNEWRFGFNILFRLNRSIAPTPYLRTFPAAWPAFALDRIYLRPISLLQDLHVVDTPLARHASDHLPLVADLALAPAGRRKLV